MSRIEKYVLEKAEDLLFITIENSSELGDIEFDIPPEGFRVPIRSEVLVKSIKDEVAQESLNLFSIVDAMLYLEGIDSGFIHNSQYDEFIEKFSERADFDVLRYLGYMSQRSYSQGEITEALCYIRSYLRRCEDVDSLYQYAIICQELSLRYQRDEDIKAMNDFLIEALNSLEKIIDIDGDFALAYYQLGFHYMNQGQFLKAKLTWENAVRCGLESDLESEVEENLINISYKVDYERGYNLVFQGEPEEGLKLLLPLEKECPQWWNLLFIIALAYKSMGERDKSKDYLSKILEFKPTQVDTLVEYALSLAEEQNLDGAIDYLTRASKIKREDPEILCNLGMAYLYNGELDEAKYYIEQAYEINPEDEVTVSCKRELEKYLNI